MPSDLDKPFAQSSENNKAPILARLKTELATARHVLEVGSGTGQHAVYFSAHLPHLVWQTSDLPVNHPGIQQWLDSENLHNARSPIRLDVSLYDWSTVQYDAVFTANSLHIMPLDAALHFLAHVAEALVEGGRFIAYGPFNYGGRYTSQSNANFDRWLAERDPRSAIRDFEQLDKIGQTSGLVLQQDYEMPANNRLLVWIKADA